MSEKRDPYHHGQLRAELLKAGLALLDGEGVDAVTVRAVARSAGVAHSAPANHFKDRRALLTGLAVEIFRGRAEAAERIFSEGAESPKERIKLFARDWLASGLAFPHRYRLIWRRDCLDPQNTILNAEMDRIYDPLVALFSEAGGQVHVSPQSQAIALWSLLHGYLSMRLNGNLVEGLDEITGRPREDAILESWLTSQNI
ncbi:MAG: TetR/AcrR family transcriptional regulator [Parvibaculum sp.]